jgi:hypothetical protein
VACKRGAAASASETEAARWCVAALRRCEPGKGFSAAKSCTHGCYTERGSSHTHLEVQGKARASTMAGTRRGRSGHSDEPVKTLQCTRKREKGGVVLLTTQKRSENVHGRGWSDGGELGRHADGGRQGAARSSDEGRIPGTGEARMSVEHKGEERRKARGSFTGDELRAAGNVPAAKFRRATARARGLGWRA